MRDIGGYLRVLFPMSILEQRIVRNPNRLSWIPSGLALKTKSLHQMNLYSDSSNCIRPLAFFHSCSNVNCGTELLRHKLHVKVQRAQRQSHSAGQAANTNE
jgi:hypothetical protein